jgi:molecular chaperone IbpA
MHINTPEPWDNHKNPYININPHEPWDKKDKWQKPVPSKIITISDVFPRLDRLSIGWSPLLEQLKEVTNNKPSYPPYDIVQMDEDTNLLNVAVAGFNKKEITVTVKDSVITIEGKQKDKQRGEVVYQGIATRDFKLSLAIAEYWEVTNALMENGLLTIQFNKILPDELKPKVIDIK